MSINRRGFLGALGAGVFAPKGLEAQNVERQGNDVIRKGFYRELMNSKVLVFEGPKNGEHSTSWNGVTSNPVERVIVSEAGEGGRVVMEGLDLKPGSVPDISTIVKLEPNTEIRIEGQQTGKTLAEIGGAEGLKRLVETLRQPVWVQGYGEKARVNNEGDLSPTTLVHIVTKEPESPHAEIPVNKFKKLDNVELKGNSIFYKKSGVGNLGWLGEGGITVTNSNGKTEDLFNSNYLKSENIDDKTSIVLVVDGQTFKDNAEAIDDKITELVNLNGNFEYSVLFEWEITTVQTNVSEGVVKPKPAIRLKSANLKFSKPKSK